MSGARFTLFSSDGLQKLREADAALARREERLTSALDEVSKRRKAINEKLKLADELLKDLDELVGAVDEFGGNETVEGRGGHPPAPGPTSRPRKRTRRGAWTSTIKKLVHDADCPISYKSLRGMLDETPLAEKLKKTDKSFYGAIRRLSEDGHIVREGGYVFSPGAYERYKREVEAGNKSPLPKAPSGQDSPAGREVKSYLRRKPLHGATSKEILEHLMTTEVAESVRKNRTFGYNVIARLTKRGELMKHGGRYRLSDQSDEAPAEAGASNNSDAAATASESAGGSESSLLVYNHQTRSTGE